MKPIYYSTQYDSVVESKYNDVEPVILASGAGAWWMERELRFTKLIRQI